MVSVTPTRQELLESLINYTILSTGLSADKIVRGKQNAPVPLGAYCTLLYITDSVNSLAENQLKQLLGNDNQLQNNTRVQRIYTFSVQFYRDNATDLAKAFMLYYQTLEAQVFFETALFNIKNITNITENSNIVNKNYQERAILTVDLYVEENISTLVNKVDEVDINISYNNINEDIKVVKNGNNS